MPRLHTVSGPVALPSLELDGQFITIGRATGNRLHLNHRSVSKYHALIVLEENKAHLFDLHSTNGTYVNGERITTRVLQPNDEVFIGEFQLRYEAEPSAAPTPVAPQEKPPAPAPTPVVVTPAPAAAPIAPVVAQKLAVSGPRATTGSIPAPPAAGKPPPGRSFIRLPGQPSEEKPGLVKKLIARSTGKIAETPPASAPVPAVAPPPEAAAAPATSDAAATDVAAVTSPTPSPATPPPEPAVPAPAEPGESKPVSEQPVVSAPKPKGEGLLVKKPAGGGERVLVKPGGAGGDRVLKKPGAPKS